MGIVRQYRSRENINKVINEYNGIKHCLGWLDDEEYISVPSSDPYCYAVITGTHDQCINLFKLVSEMRIG